MAKSSGQKLKLLYLMDILKKHTDKDTFITMEQILALLEKHNITAERKSVYEDINALRDFGLEIELVRNKGYHLLTRDFETSELKLLVDAVQASKFITEKKSTELIKKLENLTSKNNASELQHSVIMRERIKTMNESVFLTVDSIQLAMAKNKKLSFKYFDWDIYKKKVYKKDGKSYIVSPQALTWDDENYYLLAFDEDAQILKHFRVDKMTALFTLDEKRSTVGTTRFNTAEYSKKMFGMYGGQLQKVKLQCDASLAGVFIDRFGLNSIITPLEDHFEIIVEVALSPVFLSWLMQFGNKVKVLSPENVKEELIKLANKVLEINK